MAAGLAEAGWEDPEAAASAKERPPWPRGREAEGEPVAVEVMVERAGEAAVDVTRTVTDGWEEKVELVLRTRSARELPSDIAKSALNDCRQAKTPPQWRGWVAGKSGNRLTGLAKSSGSHAEKSQRGAGKKAWGGLGN